VNNVKALEIDIIHYNKNRKEIDIHSDEIKDKIKQTVFDTINQKIQK
jgi:hypothetical protein